MIYDMDTHYTILNNGKTTGKWEITEEVYDYFLSILPPIYMSGGFCIREMNHDRVTTFYSFQGSPGDRFFCEWFDLATMKATQEEN